MKHKKTPLLLKSFVFVYIALLASMCGAWAVSYIHAGGTIFPPKISNLIIEYSNFPSKVYQMITGLLRDDRSIYNTEINDLNISYKDQYANKSPFLLVPTFSDSDSLEVKLMSTHDFNVKKKWSISGDYILQNREKSRRHFPLAAYHPLLLKDSSLIFSSDVLFRLDKSNNILWNNVSRQFHHSIEMEGDSTIWTGSKFQTNKYFNFGLDTIRNDALCAIDIHTGKIKFEKSVAEILVENGYMYLLQVGKFENDVVHLNDIQPITIDSKYWTKGDLFISLRHRNTVFLYRPSTNKILWLKTGPWLAQHDVDVVDAKTIMIFGNDVLRGRKEYLVNGYNDIYFYNFEKDSVYTPYSQMMKKHSISSKTQGRCDLFPNGDLFIDESNNGKLYVISKDSIKMKYVERIDGKHIKTLSWVRPIYN
jgi:hypothetical protein